MNKVRFLVATVLAVLLAACSEEENVSQAGKPGFVVSLTESVKVESRRTPEGIGKPAASNFQLKITRQSDGFEAYNGSYTADLIPAPVGTYTLEAEQGDNPELALDAPYYKGTIEAEVTSEAESTPVTIQCKVANALASVVFDDSGAYKFDDQFESYGVRVAFPSISTVLRNDGKSAYYRAGTKPVFTFEGTLEDGTHIESVPLNDEKLSNDTTFAAGQHCVITLKLGATSSGVRVEISKVKVKKVTIEETIPLEWLPAPKVSATGFINNTLDFYETSAPQETSINFEVNQIAGLEDLEFEVNFEDEQFQNLNGSYTLSAMTEEDKAKFADAGITIPVKGQTAPKINFSEDFISQLRAKNDGVVANTITINKVTANNRPNKDESPLVYTINTHKPEFTVEVQPGNVWSKTIIADDITIAEGKGDLETIKNNMVYQYQDTDGVWKDFSNQAERTQVFDSHPESRNYKVRAFYRDALTSNEVDIELEDDVQIPNGGMEAWTDSSRETKYLWISTNQPFALPWYGDMPQWWDTNSIATMPERYDIAGQASAACFATITYTLNGNSGKAAVIRTIGHGRSNSGAASGTHTRGILYAGKTSDDGSMNEGQNWNSRPDAFSFYCKYSSYENERYGVYIELYANDILIASGSNQGGATESFTLIEIPINYTDVTTKATEIQIRFCSVEESNDSPEVQHTSINVPEGSADNYTTWNGSTLYVDDVKLIYGK